MRTKNSCIDQAGWLDDYALFRALKTRYNGAYYVEWPSDLVYREPSAMARARRELKDEIDQIMFRAVPVLPPGRAA